MPRKNGSRQMCEPPARAAVPTNSIPGRTAGSERLRRKGPNEKAEENRDSPKEPGENPPPEPDPGVCERRLSGQFGYRPEDWPVR